MDRAITVLIMFTLTLTFATSSTYLIYEDDYDRTIESGMTCVENETILSGISNVRVCEDENFCNIEYNDPECVGGYERQTTRDKNCVPCEYGCYDYGCYDSVVECDDLKDCRMYENEVFIIDEITFGTNRMLSTDRWFNFNWNNKQQSVQKEEGERQRLAFNEEYIYYITISEININDDENDYIEFDLEREKIVQEEEAPDCSETDNGDDPYTYGKLDSGLVDACSDAGTLDEFYCDSKSDTGFSQKIYECQNGCADGACLKEKLDKDVYEEEKTKDTVKEVDSNKDNLGELKRPVKVEDLEGEDCNGCVFGDQCYPFGFRKDGNYCSGEEDFLSYKTPGEICENNFECDSNVCVSGQCVDGGLINRILNWFKQVFGSE